MEYHQQQSVFVPVISTLTKPFYAMDDFLEAQAFLQVLVKKLDRSTVDLIKNLLNRNDGGNRDGRTKPRNLDTGSYTIMPVKT